jgi:transposase
MTREGLDSLDKKTLTRLVLARAETIAAVTKQCETLLARAAELERKLGLPPKTPDNSSTPPRALAKAKSEGRRKSHAGAHRPLHPNPTSKRDIAARACQHRGADVSRRPRLACETYDHIEIPPIKSEVARVMLYGGVRPCRAEKFKAKPPADMPKGKAPRDGPSINFLAPVISPLRCGISANRAWLPGASTSARISADNRPRPGVTPM